ncbi:MAG: sulfite exporter TauE/SafE family protein [Planctomycetes bacterium]|nr:sulfite exporter TauE/SafE family protein [Planctomycetota bacterium]
MEFLLPACVFLVAAIYASVGHGGASGYLAVLGLFNAPPESMRASALVLNILVAGTAWIAFARGGHFRGRRVAPFLLLSIPCAWYGGSLKVAMGTYMLLLGLVLAWAGIRLTMPEGKVAEPRSPGWLVSVPAGGAIGLLSGVVGVGGGIFLSPLLILSGWATAREAAAASACFIVLNSAAGLAGGGLEAALAVQNHLPLVGAAFAGGLLGSTIGAGRLSNVWLRRMLGAVLLGAAIKLAKSSL